MFDTVVIENLKLPNLPKDVQKYLDLCQATIPSEFQTKDLDNLLSTYIINNKGQIFVTEYKPTGKKISAVSFKTGWFNNRSFLERVYFKLKARGLNYKYPASRYVAERKPVLVKTSFTNTFEIYTNDIICGRYVELSFSITAIKGKVSKIELRGAKIESEKDAKKRIKQQEKWDTDNNIRQKKKHEFVSKWYYPLLKETYNPLVFFSIKIIQSFCHFIIKQTYRWHGV